MKQRIIPWLLAVCLIASMFVSVSAANVTAQQIAQDYSQVLAESTLRSTTDRPVMFYDLTRDGVPEMILLCRGKSGGELQVWTWRSGSAELALSLDWVEVSASKHWLYLMKDGTLAWYYTNSGYTHPYATVSHIGTRYVWTGGGFEQTDRFEYVYREGNGVYEPLSATHNRQTVKPEEGARLDSALRADAVRTLMTPMDDVPGAMTGREAQAYLSSITGRFFDVPAGKYYTEPVAWAVENGITAGTSEYTFSPDRPCTRAQAVTFLWRAAGQPAPKRTSTRFTDLRPGAFYEKAVLWAVENGVTTGTSATTFSPDTPCTRGQIVTLLWRATGSPQAAGSSFSDVPAGSYFEIPVSWAVAAGITNGVAPGRFAPNDPCTRGQIVTFLYRARSITIDPKPDAWSDAYRRFVLDQSFLNGKEEYSYDAGFFLVRLYDLDGDGTPELIIDNGSSGRATRWAYIYTYSGGQIRCLGVGPSESYRNPADPKGVYGRYSLSPDENWTKYDKVGGSIVTSSAGTFPLFTGHKDFIPLDTKTVEQIRDMGWEAFLDTQALS